MQENEIRQIPLVAFFAALGILFPQFFHFLGLGPAFLPMFIPILIGSMFVNWRFALLMGVLSPTISWLITGMPPIIPPILPILVTELCITGMIISILRQSTIWSVWIILPIGLLVDRILLLVIVIVIAPLFDITHPLFSLTMVLVGVPGVILQLLVVPASVLLIEKRYPHWKPAGKHQ